MKVKLWLIVGTVLLGLTSLSFLKSKQNMTPEKLSQATPDAYAGAYQQHFKQFSYYIEAIGTVTIDDVELTDKTLTARYSYRQGSEDRQVLSVLTRDSDGIYKGTCITKVDNKVLFTVNTWLTFNKNGTAAGNWSWTGSPTKQDPVVTISKN